MNYYEGLNFVVLNECDSGDDDEWLPLAAFENAYDAKEFIERCRNEFNKPLAKGQYRAKDFNQYRIHNVESGETFDEKGKLIE